MLDTKRVISSWKSKFPMLRQYKSQKLFLRRDNHILYGINLQFSGDIYYAPQIVAYNLLSRPHKFFARVFEQRIVNSNNSTVMIYENDHTSNFDYFANLFINQSIVNFYSFINNWTKLIESPINDGFDYYGFYKIECKIYNHIMFEDNCNIDLISEYIDNLKSNNSLMVLEHRSGGFDDWIGMIKSMNRQKCLERLQEIIIDWGLDKMPKDS